MPTYSFGLAKGLKEPCSPNRQAYFFGAALNSVNADSWNCLPSLWDPATDFNLLTLTPNHEVVVALLGISGAVGGSYHLVFTWYRKRDNKTIYQYSYDRTCQEGGWLYAYSYIGYTVNEINENGDYAAEVEITGPVVRFYGEVLTVSGVTEPEPPPVPVPGNPLDSIFSTVWDISSQFYSAHYTVSGWVWPFNLLATPLYWLYQLSWNLLTPIAQFGDWVSAVTTRVSSILSSIDVMILLRTWLTYAENAWTWVMNAGTNVTNIVNTWWSSTSQTVQVWVNEAKQYAEGLVASTMGLVINLQASWDAFKDKIPSIDAVIAWWGNWWGNILAQLGTWWISRLSEVQVLINTAFTVREGLWAGWQEWRGQVAEFFNDPLEYIWERFTDWFLGPEE